MMTTSGNGPPHSRHETAPQGACHIWQMPVPQMSATRAHCTPRGRSVLRRYLRLIALEAEDTAEPPGVCVDKRRGHRRSGRQAQLAGGRGSHARPELVARILCTSSKCKQLRSRAAFQVRSRDRNPRSSRVPLEEAGQETLSTSRERLCT